MLPLKSGATSLCLNLTSWITAQYSIFFHFAVIFVQVTRERYTADISTGLAGALVVAILRNVGLIELQRNPQCYPCQYNCMTIKKVQTRVQQNTKHSLFFLVWLSSEGFLFICPDTHVVITIILHTTTFHFLDTMIQIPQKASITFTALNASALL